MTARVTATTFVLAVPDIAAAEHWWVDKMGFECWLRVEGWVFLRRGLCFFRLGECRDAIPPRDLGDHQYFGYIEMDDVAAYHEEITRNGVTPMHPPTDQVWGMREMAVRTPDGHRVMFAQDLEP